MKKLFFFAIAGMLISACSNSGSKPQAVNPNLPHEVVVTNDMENAMAIIPSWSNERTVMAINDPPAHSGGFAIVTNDSIEYGYTYKEILKNIDSKTPKMVTYNGWIYTTVANPKPALAIICNINENDKQYDWKAYPLEKELIEAGKWVEFTATFYFDQKPLKPEQEIGLYAWNLSKKPIFIDDVKITFIY